MMRDVFLDRKNRIKKKIEIFIFSWELSKMMKNDKKMRKNGETENIEFDFKPPRCLRKMFQMLSEVFLGKNEIFFLHFFQFWWKMQNNIFFSKKSAKKVSFSKCPALQVFSAVTIVDGLPPAESTQIYLSGAQVSLHKYAGSMLAGPTARPRAARLWRGEWARACFWFCVVGMDHACEMSGFSTKQVDYQNQFVRKSLGETRICSKQSPTSVPGENQADGLVSTPTSGVFAHMKNVW